MKPETYELFLHADRETIVKTIEDELKTRNESPFWSDKVVPFSEAILSVLIPLRDNNLLFDPQNRPQASLTPELFFEWHDFLSLKTLAFTIQKSNAMKALQRTQYDAQDCARYEEIDLTLLGNYLARYTVNLEDELLDFPIANYNLHQGVSNVIESLFANK